MFRDCLNIYGWAKRAENECKEYYGKYDYERRIKDKQDSFENMKQ